MSIDGLTADTAGENAGRREAEDETGGLTWESGALVNVSGLQVITSITSVFLTRCQSEGSVQDLIM